ncbi:hypothetical protein ACUL41_17325 [Virgibacillus natechei]
MNIIWLPKVKKKLFEYRSKHFASEETFDFISTIIIETEELLKNPFVSKTYTEEFGEFKGVSRVLVRKLTFYFERDKDNMSLLQYYFHSRVLTSLSDNEVYKT